MDKMNLIAVYPEIVILVMTCVIALFDLSVKSPNRTATYVLTQLTLVIVAAMELSYFGAGYTFRAWGGMVVADPLADLLKFFAVVTTMVILAYARPYAAEKQLLKGEFFTLTLFILLGAMVMISGHNFLTLYLGLEVLSLALYALVALRRDHGRSTEAAMKYFVLGALASGFLLYGMSMVYGATGSLDVASVFRASARLDVNQPVLVFGLVFLVAGLAFKLGVVPFHMWVPDVYEGAPTVVTLIVSSVPKLAAFAMCIRLLVGAMLLMFQQWQQMLIVLSVLSLLVGNFAAIMQSNVKRMLAYSTISQMGFVLLGLLSGGIGTQLNFGHMVGAYGAALFYVIGYVLTTLATFGVLIYLSRNGVDCERLDDLKGLNRRSPLVAGVMAVAMFSLAGVPPTVGFYAKLSVLQALVTTGQTGLIALTVFAVLMSLVGAFYYLRIVKLMYFDAPPEGVASLEGQREQRFVLSLNGFAVLFFGVLPGSLMMLSVYAIGALLSVG